MVKLTKIDQVGYHVSNGLNDNGDTDDFVVEHSIEHRQIGGYATSWEPGQRMSIRGGWYDREGEW